MGFPCCRAGLGQPGPMPSTTKLSGCHPHPCKLSLLRATADRKGRQLAWERWHEPSSWPRMRPSSVTRMLSQASPRYGEWRQWGHAILHEQQPGNCPTAVCGICNGVKTQVPGHQDSILPRPVCPAHEYPSHACPTPGLGHSRPSCPTPLHTLAGCLQAE